MSDTKTLEEIIPDKQMRDKIYGLMILNEQNIMIENESLLIIDPTFPTNNGTYFAEEKRYFKYLDDRFLEIDLKVPYDWKKTSTYFNKMREMD